MVLGVGSFAHSLGGALADAGADVSTYLTRNYGHFPPTLTGKTFSRETFPSPLPLIRENKTDVVIPQSIDWATQPWADDLIKSGVGIFSPTGEAMRIERERDFARELCVKFKIPFPKAFVASNRIEAEKILAKIRSRSSSRTRSVRRRVRFTRFCARRWPTRARGCGRSIMPKAFSCRNISAAPKPDTLRS